MQLGQNRLAMGLVNVINCTRMGISFQVDAMVLKGQKVVSVCPKSLPLQLTDGAYGGIHPRGVEIGPSLVAVSFSKLVAEIAEGLFF